MSNKVEDLNVESEIVKEEITGETKKKKSNWFSRALICIGIICIGIAVYGLYGIYREYKEADDIYKEAEKEFVEVLIPENDTTEIDGTEVEVPRGPWYELARIDLAGLQKKYPDIIGWIYFEDGLISYPVMQTTDNETYLHITYNGKQAKAGSIFMEASHSSDFSNTHTLIYGHNMNNLSMFGRLKHYKNDGYYEGHEYFQIFRGNEILRYQIFAYQDVPIDSFVYQEYFTSAKELAKRLSKKSYIKTDLTIEPDDKIITLSTCNGNDKYRFVVSAVLIEKYNLTDNTITEE